MKTAQNRLVVAAIVLRGSVGRIRVALSPEIRVALHENECVIDTELLQIESAAEEIEAAAREDVTKDVHRTGSPS